MSASGADLSIVIPAYNEAACIRETMTALSRVLSGRGVVHELIVLDNGSTDSTGAILESLRPEIPGLRVIHLKKNVGYGQAILSGLAKAAGGVVGFTCADGEVGPEDIVVLLRVLEAGQLDLCKGKRIGRQDGPLRKLISVGYQLLVGCLFRIHITDINGYPLLLSREAYRRIGAKQADWIVNLDILLRARNNGLRIAEVDVRHLARAGGRSHVRWYHPLLFLWQLLAYWRRQSLP